MLKYHKRNILQFIKREQVYSQVIILGRSSQFEWIQESVIEVREEAVFIARKPILIVAFKV